jgi:hypothetical protein
VSHIEGEVIKVEHTKNSATVFIKAYKPETREYYIPHDHEQKVKTGEMVKVKQVLSISPETKQKITAPVGGVVSKVENGIIYISDTEAQTLDYVIPFGRKLTVVEGQKVAKGGRTQDGRWAKQSSAVYRRCGQGNLCVSGSDRQREARQLYRPTDVLESHNHRTR